MIRGRPHDRRFQTGPVEDRVGFAGVKDVLVEGKDFVDRQKAALHVLARRRNSGANFFLLTFAAATN